jgi:hypothetical protein
MNSLLLVFLIASIGVQGRPPSAPNPPGSLSVTTTAISASSLRLEWQDNSPNETAFEIGRCLGVTCKNFAVLAKVPANTNTFTDTNLKPKTTYRYRVRVLGKGKTVLSYSKIVAAATLTLDPTPAQTPTRASTPARGAPAAPSNLAASAVSTSQISLTWTVNSNNQTGFIVERALLAAGPWTQVATTPANATSWGNAGLSELTTYYYRIIAYNSAGNSPYSNVASAATLSMLPAGAPSHLVATAQSSSQINLTWSDDSNDETGFKIERCQGSGCSSFTEIATTAASVTHYESTDLSPSTSYSYRIRAYNSTENSGYSKTATAKTVRDTMPPTIPAQLTATAVMSSRIDLHWKPAACSGGVRVAGYAVYQAGVPIVNTPKTRYSVTGLSANTLYCYTVAAYDNEGNRSDQTDSVCATTKPDPTTDPNPSGDKPK